MRSTNGRHTANRALQDASIRHAVYLQRLKTGQANRVLGMLQRDVYPGLRQMIRDRVARIERLGSDTGPATTARLNEISDALTAIPRAMERVRASLESDLTDLSHVEAAWQVKAINAASPIGFDLTTPAPATLRSLVVARPMQGRLLREWWSGVDTTLRGGIMRDLRLGIAAGRPTPEIVRSLLSTTQGPLALSRRNAEAVVRTAVSHVSTHTRHATFEENDDVVASWQWVSTLDHRTCLVCGKLDGSVWELGGGPPNPEGGFFHGGDAHFNCRCTPSPVTKSWAELGIDLKEAAPGTRASMDGAVPDSVTYADWIPEQSAEFQDDTLGPTRGNLLRSGKAEFNDFVDDRSRELTLPEIAEREGLTQEDISRARRPRVTEEEDAAFETQYFAPFIASPEELRRRNAELTVIERRGAGLAIPAVPDAVAAQLRQAEAAAAEAAAAEARRRKETIAGQIDQIAEDIARVERDIRFFEGLGRSRESIDQLRRLLDRLKARLAELRARARGA